MDFVISTDCRTGKTLQCENVNVVVYHSKCTDGFAAAYAVWAVRGDAVTFIPREHTASDKAAADIMPLLVDKHVLVVDYCFPIHVTQEIMRVAAALLVLDHHESARVDMMLLPDANKVFEMHQSGATLAYNFMHGHAMPVPRFLRYVEDYDIWNKALPNTEAFSISIRDLPFDFVAWNTAVLSTCDDAGLEAFVARGAAQVAWRDEHVRSISAAAKPCVLRGFEDVRASAINTSFSINEVAHAMLAGDTRVAVVWRAQMLPHGVKCIVSLRSHRVGHAHHVNVALIAHSFGGGGHASAAGFDCVLPFATPGNEHPPFWIV
jgi:uncharacterized protein